MVLPLRALAVPFASRGSATDQGGETTASLDFDVSGAGNRLQGLMLTSLAAADRSAPSETEVFRDSGEGGEEGNARDGATAGGGWAGFAVKDGPTGQVRENASPLFVPRRCDLGPAADQHHT